MNERESILRDIETLKALRNTKILQYRPYSKQAEFHALSATKTERVLMAGNRLGKSECGAAEMGIHLTGLYPDWWEGRVFDHPVKAWVGGNTSETTRDIIQGKLLGRQGAWGTGFIPKAHICDIAKSRAMKGGIDYMTVRNQFGGESYLSFKSFDQQREKWQGEDLDLLWFDEEPPPDIYSEGLARLTDRDGIAWLTFTPLKGITEVVDHFYPEPDTPRRGIVQMTIEDAEHIPPERRAEVIAKYRPHEREARIQGIPMLGSGRVYPVVESEILCDSFPIPDFYHRIVGLDFGWEHPTAAVWMAIDRDTNTRYIYDCYAQTESTVAVHASTLRMKGDWIPIAWPHDGMKHDLKSGTPLATHYRNHGLLMLHEHAQFIDGSNGLEAGVQMVLEYFLTGRLKIFSHLLPILQEIRTYHRKNGKIVDKKDDLLSAIRYACMMERYARHQDQANRMPQVIGLDENPLMAQVANSSWKTQVRWN